MKIVLKLCNYSDFKLQQQFTPVVQLNTVKMVELFTFERLIDEGERQSFLGFVGKFQLRESSASFTGLRPLDLCIAVIDRFMSQGSEYAASVLEDTMTAKEKMFYFKLCRPANR